MRILRFRVDGQRLKKSAGCDFSGITRGSSGYLCARFDFSTDWDGYAKAACFYNDGIAYYAPLDAENRCMIPTAALTGRMFGVSVTGRKGSSTVTTNKERVRQNG